MRKISFIFLLSIGFFACKKHQLNDCFSSAGKDGEETRSLESFHEIMVGDKIELKIIQDPNQDEKIILKGGSNLFEGIVTLVENGRLTIDNQNVCNFVRSYKKKLIAEVYLKTLDKLEVTTAANVTSIDTIDAPYLNILHYANGDLNLTLKSDEVFVQSLNGAATILKGEISTLKSSIEGISYLDMRDVNCQNVFLDTHSPLDCFINATEIIFVKIYNSGNIFYVTEPSTQKEVNEKTGEGELLLLQ